MRVPLPWLLEYCDPGLDVHAIEEHARHNGHADLIRELIDGHVGW